MRSISDIVSNYSLPIVLGVSTTGLLVALDVFILSPLIESTGHTTLISSTESAQVWSGLLASLYGGITEEILLRLGFMTLVIWVITNLNQTDEGNPTHAGIWTGIVLTSIVFLGLAISQRLQ